MSAFIGPIHSWLYNKIIFQDKLADIVLNIAKDKGYDLKQSTDSIYGQLEKDELENIIDKSNIHGWLQEKVNLVENRLAYTVTNLTKLEQDSMKTILKEIKAFGKTNAEISDKNAEEIYVLLDEVLLNGMPCDRVNSIEEKSEDVVIWKQNVDIHDKYWIQVGGDSQNYYDIRYAFVEGMLSGSEFEFVKLEDCVYSIRRK